MMASPARRRSKSRAESAPTTTSRSSTAARWRIVLAHAPDGPVNKGVSGDGNQRLPHELVDRHVECGCAMRSDRAQQITLSDDTGILRAHFLLAVLDRAYKERRNAFLHQPRQ